MGMRIGSAHQEIEMDKPWLTTIKPVLRLKRGLVMSIGGLEDKVGGWGISDGVLPLALGPDKLSDWPPESELI